MSYLVWGRTWWYVIPAQCTHHINMRFVLIVLPGRLCMSYLHTQFFPPLYLILTWGPTLHVSHLYLIFVIFAAGDLYEVCPIWCDWGGSEALDFKMLNNFKICSSLILVVHPSSSSFLWIKEWTSKCFLTSRSLNLLKNRVKIDVCQCHSSRLDSGHQNLKLWNIQRCSLEMNCHAFAKLNNNNLLPLYPPPFWNRTSIRADSCRECFHHLLLHWSNKL